MFVTEILPTTLVGTASDYQHLGVYIRIRRIPTSKERFLKKKKDRSIGCAKAKSFKTKDIGIWQTFVLYLGESWNKLDCLCIFMYIASIVLESYNTNLTLNAAR